MLAYGVWWLLSESRRGPYEQALSQLQHGVGSTGGQKTI